jgi:ABC-type multidrug transport system fused ATPase/permease subunit
VVTDSMQLAGVNVATSEEVSAGVAVEGLTVKFRGTPLIDSISNLFEPNKVTAIVGPTGCARRRCCAPSTACTTTSPACR